MRATCRRHLRAVHARPHRGRPGQTGALWSQRAGGSGRSTPERRQPAEALPAASPSPASWGSARPPLASGVATPQESDLVCAPGSVRESNIVAAKAVADAVRTSLGPRGMDKMVPPARLILRGLRGGGARSRPPQGHAPRRQLSPLTRGRPLGLLRRSPRPRMRWSSPTTGPQF